MTLFIEHVYHQALSKRAFHTYTDYIVLDKRLFSLNVGPRSLAEFPEARSTRSSSDKVIEALAYSGSCAHTALSQLGGMRDGHRWLPWLAYIAPVEEF